MKKMQRIVCVVMLLAILLGLVTMGVTSCIDGKTQNDDDIIYIEDGDILEDGDIYIEDEDHEGHDHE